MNCLDVTTKTAALSKNSGKLRFTISANYGYVYDFENVKRIIWSYQLQKTTKFALFKAPKYFGRKCKLQS